MNFVNVYFSGGPAHAAPARADVHAAWRPRDGRGGAAAGRGGGRGHGGRQPGHLAAALPPGGGLFSCSSISCIFVGICIFIVKLKIA